MNLVELFRTIAIAARIQGHGLTQNPYTALGRKRLTDYGADCVPVLEQLRGYLPEGFLEPTVVRGELYRIAQGVQERLIFVAFNEVAVEAMIEGLLKFYLS
jgi:hypothetical protein